MGKITGGEREKRERRKLWEQEFANNLSLESANDSELPKVKGKSSVEKHRFEFAIMKKPRHHFEYILDIYFGDEEDKLNFYGYPKTCEEAAHQVMTEAIDFVERVHLWRGEEREMFDIIAKVMTLQT